ADIARRPATEDLIVTATRVPAPRLNLIGNTTRLDEQRIALTNHQHINELGTAAAGTWISRGSGQENLTAIRSPVLTGPGACGAFLTLENGIPTRPTGFCNVNQLFEIPSELASSAEALRGPANALYGSNGLHGTLNFLLPRPAESPGWRAGLEAGPDDFRRLRITADATPREQGIAGGLLVDHYDGFRADSGYDQQKGYLEWAPQSDTSHLQLTFSGSHLDQQTAGFIRGFEAYKDPELRISNPDPDAFRKGDSQRVSLHWQPAGNAIDSRLFMRRSDMEFLQHFLPGKPLEQNGQISGGWMLTVQRDGMGGHLTAGTDAEFMSGFLREIQAQEIAPDSNRPAGRHYDYDVNSQMAAVYAQFDRPVGRLWTVQAGLRLEYLRYGYDNKLPDGNTRDDGTNCPAGCLFYRPADRSDDFLQAAPNLGLLFRIDEYDSLFASLTRGFRAPQATELYRLQNGQTVADLKPETLDSVEVGWHRSTERLQIELTGFAMRKHNVIFRDSNGFNVSDGRTMHAGVELQAFARAQNGLYTGFA
ncbi:MAG TPA: TonB-dependent receptor, partial [Chromatiales bacterium]|nr:TonB-dependent receptor [Chromatiales bacterium]